MHDEGTKEYMDLPYEVRNPPREDSRCPLQHSRLEEWVRNGYSFTPTKV